MDIEIPAWIEAKNADELIDIVCKLRDEYGSEYGPYISNEGFIRDYVRKFMGLGTMSVYYTNQAKGISFWVETEWFAKSPYSAYTKMVREANHYTYEDIFSEHCVVPDVFDLFEQCLEV